jgi:LPS-assembly lipoprotein
MDRVRPSRRQLLLAAAPLLVLGGCGFQLRQAPTFDFQTLYLALPVASSLGTELQRSIEAAGVRVLTEPRTMATADVILDVLSDQRERVVVGMSAAGQVREFQLRVRLKLRLRTPQGRELLSETELLQQRDISYSETAALAKEAEQEMLYRSMQTDIVQQVMRRLAAARLR